MVGGHRRGRVVCGAARVGDGERAESELDRELGDGVGSGDRGPGAAEVFGGVFAGQGLERVQRTDLDVGAGGDDRCERVHATRTG